jgi:hypothetical protein
MTPGETNMERKYIALALVGLIGCVGLVSAGVIGVEFADGYMLGTSYGTDDIENGVDDDGPTGPGAWLRERIRDRVQNRMQDRVMQHRQHQMQRGAHMAENYLNLTRLEGVLVYDNDTESYMIDNSVLYLGDEYFLASLAQSDYDQDGSYEYVWEELQGLIGSDIVVNGLLENDTLYVSHINGIWLRVPREVTLMELDGILEYRNGSYVIDGVILLFPKHGMSRSDIDGDGSLERLKDELDGLVGEQISVDGASVDKGIVVAHVNGISVR